MAFVKSSDDMLSSGPATRSQPLFGSALQDGRRGGVWHSPHPGVDLLLEQNFVGTRVQDQDGDACTCTWGCAARA